MGYLQSVAFEDAIREIAALYECSELSARRAVIHLACKLTGTCRVRRAVSEFLGVNPDSLFN